MSVCALSSDRGVCVGVCTGLIRRLELRRSSGEQKVKHGAVGYLVTNSWTAGNQLTGLKQQGPKTQNNWLFSEGQVTL